MPTIKIKTIEGTVKSASGEFVFLDKKKTRFECYLMIEYVCPNCETENTLETDYKNKNLEHSCMNCGNKYSITPSFGIRVAINEIREVKRK